ncbi:MAG: AAA family ATPase [bacterium]
MIIGITGTIGAGKGTVVEYLKSRHNFSHYSVRDVLVEELNKRGMDLSRDSMVAIANELREKNGAGHFMEVLLKRAIEGEGDAVIESVRTTGEIETLRAKAPDFYLLAVDADPRVRYERIVKRNSSTDKISYEKFLADEAKESHHTEKWLINLPVCISQADFKLTDNDTFDDLHNQIDKILMKLSFGH